MRLNFVIEDDIATTQLLEQVFDRITSKEFSYEKFYLRNLPIGFPDAGTITLFARCCSPELKPWLSYLNRLNTPFLYFLDDNFWEIRGTDALARYYQDPIVRETLDSVVRNARACISNTEVLASYMSDMNENQIVLPAFFNFDLLGGHQNQLESDEIRIGFAGSSSRQKDVEAIADAIRFVVARYPSVIFEFIGINPSKLKLPETRVRAFPHLPSYEEYVQFQVSRNWTIGLAPLESSKSNQSKTNNKYREYGAMGIPCVFQKATPYLECVEDGITGLLAGSTAEWIDRMSQLIENESLRATILENARNDVRAKHDLAIVASEWFHSLVQFDEKSLLPTLRKVMFVPELWIRTKFSKITHGQLQIRVTLPELGIKEVLKRINRKIFAGLRQSLLEIVDTYKIGGALLVLIKLGKRVFRRL